MDTIRKTATVMGRPDYQDALTLIRTELSRVDNKALGLAAINLGAIGLYGTVLRGSDIVYPLRGGAAVGLVLVVLSLVRFLLATRPNLSGDSGFVRYARVNSRAALDVVVARDQGDQAGQVLWLSKCVQQKYQHVRGGVHLLMYSPVWAGIAALLAAL